MEVVVVVVVDVVDVVAVVVVWLDHIYGYKESLLGTKHLNE